jgi:hypothetical protein
LEECEQPPEFPLTVGLAIASGEGVGLDQAPAAISLSLSSSRLKSSMADDNGVPCGSWGADKVSCANLAHTKHVTTYYAFCDVGVDTVETCPEPEATGYDHHDGKIEVIKTVKLFIGSDRGAYPRIANSMVDAIDYSKRGEYTLIYDAQDRAGNAATTLFFHFFVVDHVPPEITHPQFTVPHDQRYYIIPSATATDNYDGNVDSTVSTVFTDGNGHNHSYFRESNSTPPSHFAPPNDVFCRWRTRLLGYSRARNLRNRVVCPRLCQRVRQGLQRQRRAPSMLHHGGSRARLADLRRIFHFRVQAPAAVARTATPDPPTANTCTRHGVANTRHGVANPCARRLRPWHMGGILRVRQLVRRRHPHQDAGG